MGHELESRPRRSDRPQRPLHPINLLLLKHQFDASRDAAEVLRSRSDSVDDLIRGAAAENLLPCVRDIYAVVGTGGYGRRELFPFSDVDLLLVFESENALGRAKEPVAKFLGALWDSGLRVGHSIRTIAECVRLQQQNTELHISLLDARSICGDDALFTTFSAKLAVFYEKHASGVVRGLGKLVRQRHAKFNDTVYHLEPNVKEAPGGIRDIHLLRWLAQMQPQQGIFKEFLENLDQASLFLFAVRCFLHFEMGRDHNVLTFELQDRIAECLPQQPVLPETWMRQYYKNARDVFQPALRALDFIESQDSGFLRQIQRFRTRADTRDFSIAEGRVLVRNAEALLASPDALFSLFTFVGHHGLRLSWETQRRFCQEGAALAETFLRHPVNRTSWRTLLSEPHAAMALREMQQTGVLAAAIPEWRTVDSLVVRDFYHRYTVDEHTFVAIETIDGLLTDDEKVPARFHDLLLEEEDPAVLRFAILLHDVGKGTNPGEHVRGSLIAAGHIMERLSIPAQKQEDVCFLIEHHLDLSLIMNARDLEDPATARFLTGRVGTRERLRQLTLLTYADIAAVNPTAMTPWRLEQLWRIYLLGIEQLTRDLVMERIHPGESSAVRPEVAAFLEGLPTRYLRTHRPEEVERHFQMHKKAVFERVAVEIVREAGAYQLTVIAQDHPGLFSAVCGTLASFSMNIVKGEAFSNAAGIIVDVFRFVDPTRTLELNPGETERLEWTIQCVIRGTLDVHELLKRRKPSRLPSSGAKIFPSVRFNNEASDTATLIDFVGEDRPGLLSDLTNLLSERGCNIEVVMIDTEGHKAVDVFYVTCRGEKLPDLMQAELQDALIKTSLGT